MTEETETNARGPMDIRRVMAALPHRYPMLLIDRVESMVLNQSIHAIKAVSVNEPFFQGHFPGHPVMPGVLVIEALAQAGGILTQLSRGTVADNKLFYLVKIDNARFSRMVVPGDVLELHVQIRRIIRTMTFYTCVARVDGEEVATADVLCAETDKE